jgi:hypothetical protein
VLNRDNSRACGGDNWIERIARQLRLQRRLRNPGLPRREAEK